jgi:hypothetical protein
MSLPDDLPYRHCFARRPFLYAFDGGCLALPKHTGAICVVFIVEHRMSIWLGGSFLRRDGGKPLGRLALLVGRFVGHVHIVRVRWSISLRVRILFVALRAPPRIRIVIAPQGVVLSGALLMGCATNLANETDTS